MAKNRLVSEMQTWEFEKIDITLKALGDLTNTAKLQNLFEVVCALSTYARKRESGEWNPADVLRWEHQLREALQWDLYQNAEKSYKIKDGIALIREALNASLDHEQDNQQ